MYMKTYTLTKSNRKNKKFVIDMDGMKHHFGDARYEDFTKHKDEARKVRYITRTASQPQDDIHSPSFWSLNLLWNKNTLSDSIKDVEERYSMRILDRR
jgi:hypothetical protein